MKILILDDHPLFSTALKQIVQNINEIKAVDLAKNVNTALKFFENGNSYDLLIVDIGLPGLDGFGFMRWLQINFINTPVIIISASNDPKIAELSLKKGAKGFIHKSSDVSTILQGIKQVAQGNTYTSDCLLSEVSSNIKKSTFDPENNVGRLGITPRQLSILKLLKSGDSNKEIARKLNISDSTVKKHVSNIFTKLCVQNRTALVLEAKRLGLI